MKTDSSTPDLRFAHFGEAMWKYITNLGGEFCEDEISEDILPLAQAAGLCSRVKYNPAIHGDMAAESGDEVWWWGDQNPDTKKPAEWEKLTGVIVMDFGGWDRSSAQYEIPITRDEFLSRAASSRAEWPQAILEELGAFK